MSAPITLSPWSESLEIIDALADTATKLSLVFIVGPGDLARPGLSQVGDLIADRRQVLWHRLDEKGAALTASLRAASPDCALLLVHGLELLEPEARRDVELNLNLGRDALVDFNAMIVFWIPQDEMADFRNVCPDLFHWRSHLATAIHDEIEADLVARWRYLDWAEKCLERYLDEKHPNAQETGDHVEVGPEDGDKTSLATWAEEESRGLLKVEEPDGNRSNDAAVACLALSRARHARREHGDPIPFWLPLSGPAESLDNREINAVLQVRLPGSEGWPVQRESFENWARRGELLLIVEGLDQASGELWDFWREWLQENRIAFPRIRIIVAVRPGALSPEGWQSAELWCMSTALETPKKSRAQRLEERSLKLWERGTRNFVDTLIRSLDPAFEANGNVRREVAGQLAKFSDPRGIDALARSLDPGFESDAGVRMKASELLGKMDDPSMADILHRSLDPGFEPSRDTRKRVAIALGNLGDSRAIDTLGEFLTGERPDLEVANALVQIGNARAAAMLRRAFDPRIVDSTEYWSDLSRIVSAIDRESRRRRGLVEISEEMDGYISPEESTRYFVAAIDDMRKSIQVLIHKMENALQRPR